MKMVKQVVVGIICINALTVLNLNAAVRTRRIQSAPPAYKAPLQASSANVTLPVAPAQANAAPLARVNKRLFALIGVSIAVIFRNEIMGYLRENGWLAPETTQGEIAARLISDRITEAADLKDE